MTTEGKHFKKKNFGTSGGKTGQNNPKTVFDPQKHRWVLAVNEKDVESIKQPRKVKKYHNEKIPEKRDYKEREVSHKTGKLVKKKDTELIKEKYKKTGLRLINRESSINQGVKNKWNIFKDAKNNNVYKMKGKNKINGDEIEIVIREPKRGIKNKENIYINAFVINKKTREIISNINLEIDGKGRGLFENGFEGCVKEMQFNPKYSKYLHKYMSTELGGKSQEQAAKAVCGAILEEHGGPYLAEKQALIMMKDLLEKKYFVRGGK